MYQNYNNYYPQNAPIRTYQTSQVGLKGRPVSSLEEARAMSIDFDGSVFYFPDLANRRIYTKQINMDGTATLNMYELKEVPTTSNNTNNYVTREEFEAALVKIQSLLNQEPVQQESSKAIQEAPAFLF